MTELLLIIFIAGFLATDIWRWLGVAVSGRLSPDHPVVRWVELVSIALLMGFIVRLTVLPQNELADVPLWLRLATLALSIGLYLYFRWLPIIPVSIGFLILAGGIAWL